MLVIHLAVFPFWVCLSCWSFISQYFHSGFACHAGHSSRSISILGLIASFASSVLFSMVIRARGGVRGHGIRQRLGVSPQHLKVKRVSSCRLGRFAMEMCRSGRFSAADLSACASAGSTSEPTLRRLASAVDVGTRACERGSASNTTSTLPGTLPGCWPSSAMLRPCTSRAFQCGAKSRTARHFRRFPSCCLTRCYNTQSLKALSMTGLRPTPRKWASRTVYVIWGAHLGVDTTEGHWACMSVWGDSAPFSAKASDSVFLLTWRLLTGCHRKRYWIFAVNKRRLCACGCFGRHTMDAAFQFLAWSFRALSSGRYPRHDHKGEPFAPSSWRGKVAGQSLRIRGACVAKTGDWAWLKQVVGLIGWNDGSRRSCCWLCNARFVAGSYDDASLAAEWRTSPVDMPAFWVELSTSGQFCSKVWSIPGLRIDWLRPDFMHMVDLGITQYLSGNICWFMFSALGGRRHGTPLASRAVCAHIMNMADMAAREGGLDRLHLNLTVRKFRAQNKPKLALKAADGRHFLPILLKVLQLFFPAGSPRETVMVGCVETLCDIYKELNTWDTTTSPPRVASLARRHVILLRELHDTSDDTDLWCIYPKHHMFVHLCESTQQTRVNPQLEWCYGDESEIGVAVSLAKRSHASHIEKCLLERYRVSLD